MSNKVMQLKIASIKAELDRAKQVLKLLGIDLFFKGNNKDEARHAIGEWIHAKLGGNIHRYKCISIVPILPTGSAKFKPYAILRFIDVTDARFLRAFLSAVRKVIPQ